MRSLAAQAKFDKFHTANPQVYTKLAEYSLAVRRSGRQHHGIRRIWERMRWYFEFEAPIVDTQSPYKLNDHYTPFYSRLLMAREPELEGFFETRERRGTQSTVHVDTVQQAAA